MSETYGVTIQRRTGYEGETLWAVTLNRGSDGKQIECPFAWRWRARRFARSSRRVAKAFAAADTRAAAANEHFRADG